MFSADVFARRERSDENRMNGYYKHRSLRVVCLASRPHRSLRAGSNYPQVETVKRVLRTITADALKEPDPYPKGGYSYTIVHPVLSTVPPQGEKTPI